MIFQRQDINIADRLQIIGLQKVFYTFDSLAAFSQKVPEK